MVYNIHFKIDNEFDVYCLVFEFRDRNEVVGRYPGELIISEPGDPVTEVVMDCCLVDKRAGKCLSMPELITEYRDAIISEARKRGLLRWLVP